MKLLLLFVLLVATRVSAQETVNSTSRQEQPVAIDYFSRLGIDYLIKDNPIPDEDLIRAIPFKDYERHRSVTEDIEIEDPTSGYTIILFSDEKCRLNKQQ